jgi:hypothetical protein
MCDPDLRYKWIFVTRRILDSYFNAESNKVDGYEKLRNAANIVIGNITKSETVIEAVRVLDELASKTPSTDGLLFRLWKIPPR